MKFDMSKANRAGEEISTIEFRIFRTAHIVLSSRTQSLVQGNLMMSKRLFSLPNRWIDTIIRLQEKKPHDARAFLSIVGFVASFRFLLEMTICRSIIPRSISQLPNQLTFYLCTALLFTLGVRVLANVPWQKGLNVVMIGVFLGCFPPLIDALVLGPYECFYAYNTGWFAGWSWLFYSPEQYVDVGEAASLWSAVFLLGLYVYKKKKSIVRAATAVAWGYGTIFFCGTVIASSLYWIEARYRLGAAGAHHLAALSATLVATGEAVVVLICYLVLNPALASRVVHRSIHGAPFWGLTFLGAAYATCLMRRAGQAPLFAIDAVAVPLIWLTFAVIASIAQNDYFDRDEDSPAAAARQITLGDVRFLTFLSWLIALAALITATQIGAVLVLLNLTAIVYNADFYRAKRYFPANYKIEAVWGAGAYLIGVFAVTIGVRNPPPELWWGALLAFGGWSLFSGLKDYKDIRADRRAGNQTIYVLVHARRGSLRTLHGTLRVGLSLGMLVPPLLLQLSGLGSIGIWCVSGVAVGLNAWGLGRGPRAISVHTSFLAITLYVVGLGVVLLQ
jgi:hypothetical protein